MTAVAVFGALALLSAVVWLYRRLRRALEALDPYYPMSEPLPAMLVVRPIRGRDPGLEANVRAALAQNYPAPLETLFVLDDESDPALPILRRVLARHPTANARVVFSGTPEPDRTGKLHALIQGMAVARTPAR